MKSGSESAFLLKSVGLPLSAKAGSKAQAKARIKAKVNHQLARVVVAALRHKRMLADNRAALTVADKARVAVADGLHPNGVAMAADHGKTVRSTKKKFSGRYRKHRLSFRAAAAEAASVPPSVATAEPKWPKVPMA